MYGFSAAENINGLDDIRIPINDWSMNLQKKLANPIFAKTLQDRIQDVIAEKGDGWCMDVPIERKKLARLVMKVLKSGEVSKGAYRRLTV